MLYPGYAPSNVSKDAKYSVVSSRNGGGMEIRLVYRISARERELLTTDRHDVLVEMVNEAKIAVTGQPGGAFYINEHLHVLVPTPAGCFFVGHCDRLLQFEYEGGVISPQAPPNLQPGDRWPGPHVGIKHVLTATGNDIRYESMTGSRETRVLLSDEHGVGPARALASRLRDVKGQSGGTIYINEAGEFFAPVGSEYLYLGSLGDDVWFSPPDVPSP